METTEDKIRRIATLLSFGIPLDEIEKRVNVSSYELFLLVKAASRLLKWSNA